MNRNLFIALAFLFTIGAFTSCKHDNFEEFVGPAQCPTGQFKIIKPLYVSSNNIDFNQYPGIYGDSIKAVFSEEVTWTVTITGNSSGAKKTYKGRSMEIDTVWYGQSSDPGTFFQTGEDAKVELTIACLSDVYSQTVHISDASRFRSTLGPYRMVSDFDGAGYIDNSTVLPGYSATGWSSYFTAPNVLSFFQAGPNVSTETAAQGTNYISLRGTAGATSWFVGGTYINTPTTFPASNANDVYFNAFMSSGSNTTTTVGLTFVNAGVKYTKVVPITWVGWKMVAIRLSDFKNGNGEGLGDLTAVKSLDIGLNCASKQGQSTEMNLDFVIFTSGGPFYQ